MHFFESRSECSLSQSKAEPLYIKRGNTKNKGGRIWRKARNRFSRKPNKIIQRLVKVSTNDHNMTAWKLRWVLGGVKVLWLLSSQLQNYKTKHISLSWLRARVLRTREVRDRVQMNLCVLHAVKRKDWKENSVNVGPSIYLASLVKFKPYMSGMFLRFVFSRRKITCWKTVVHKWGVRIRPHLGVHCFVGW